MESVFKNRERIRTASAGSNFTGSYQNECNKEEIELSKESKKTMALSEKASNMYQLTQEQ